MSFRLGDSSPTMYWLAPGRKTADRTRALIIYGIYAVAGVAVVVATIVTNKPTSQDLLYGLWVVGLLALSIGYVAWRNHIDGPRTMFGERIDESAQPPARPGGPTPVVGGARPASILPATYVPAPSQPVMPPAAPEPGAGDTSAPQVSELSSIGPQDIPSAN